MYVQASRLKIVAPSQYGFELPVTNGAMQLVTELVKVMEFSMIDQNGICIRIAILQIIICLSGCAEPTEIKQLSKNTYQIVYEDTDPLAQANTNLVHLDRFSMKQCPRGYEKLKEQIMKHGNVPTHIWTIRCEN